MTVMMMTIEQKGVPGAAVMLALKCLANMFKNQSPQHVMK